MKRIVLLITSMDLTLLFASGVALALNTIRCSAGTCNGTARSDRLVGTEYGDSIYGRLGGDTLHGKNGADYLYGNKGDDVLHGGNAADRLCGGPGDDLLDGGANLPYESGGDRYYFNGGWGKDTITDTDYAEYLSFSGCRQDAVPTTGMVQTDLIIKLAPVRGPQVSDGTNTIEWGRLPIASLEGGLGDDRMTGDGRGNNLNGGLGKDVIRSGAGPDRIDAGHDQEQPDFVDCGDGSDAVVIDGGIDTVSANCEHVYP